MSTTPNTNPEWDALVAQITATETIEDGALVYINAQAAKILDLTAQLAASPQKAQLIQLANDMTAHSGPVATAIATVPAA